MRYFFVVIALTSSLFAELEIKGHVGLDSQFYLQLPNSKHQNNFTASEALELTYGKDAWQFGTSVYAQQDYYDISNDDDENERTFVRVEELYAQYEFEEDAVFVGRNIRFWGALEVRNIVDGFNPLDLRTDLFNTDKMGAWNLAYTHYTDDGELSIIVKLYEENQKMAAIPYAYYFFPPNVMYDETLQSETSRYRPTLYFNYTGSLDWEYPLDVAVTFQNGYDSQRYFEPDGPLDGSAVTFQEHAYLVNKLMTYNTMVVGATLLKLEALYTDVIDNASISDYYHIGLGVEHTLNFDAISGDLGMIGEYYRYETLEDDKYSDLELFETFQNDLFLGVRYTFNDVDDSSLVGGVILDLDYDEQAYYLEYESRFGESLKLNLDYRYIEPSKDHLTAYALLQKHERFGLKLGYYF